jgi:RNA binding exosome subunit
MVNKLPVRAIYGETFCHESEDLDKVKKAMEVFFSKKDIKQKTQLGAYGTKVRVLSAEVKGRKARDLAERILESLSDLEKSQILDEKMKRMSEEGKFYLRFDKQVAYEKGKISLCNCEDAIQIILSLEGYPAKMTNFLKSAREIFS